MKTLVRDETFEMTKNLERGRRFFEDRLSFMMTPHTLYERLNNRNFQIIDVRETRDYNNGHIPGSINMPMERMETMWNTFDKNKIMVFYCYNGYCHLSTKTALWFNQREFNTMILDGGFEAWEDFGFNVER